MKPGAYFFTFCFSLIFTVAYSQNSAAFLGNAVVSLKKQTAAHPAEKVYLHLDKPHYAIGDTIWFKAYAVIGDQHKLSALSGVLYVELINPKDSVIKRLTLPLTAGVAWGDISLLRSYKAGSYHLRAYTNWMRNSGADYFYNKRIQIGAVQTSIAGAKQSEPTNPDVQFFAEGGQLVNGIRSRIAIKAVNSSGLGQDIQGTIEDSRGNTVADFTTQHLGMGVFALTPQSGETYKAKIKGAGETGFTVDLPPAADRGFTLALNNTLPDSIYVRVAVNEKTFNEQKNDVFYIVAQSNGKVYYTSQGTLEGLAYTAKVDKGRFPSGIAQFTLFSQSGEPLAERVAFIQNNDTLKLNVTAPPVSYTTRQPVTIALSVKGNNNKPATGSFSVAVINESRVGIDEDAEGTILNNLLLTSDLKGYIEQPNYYFTNENERTRADLDVLMLTQGYRRFDWKQVLSNPDQAPAYLPERSLQLSGTLKTPSGNPVPNGKVTLVATKQNVLRDTTTDANGNFIFTGLYLPDTAKLVLRARKQHNGSNVAIYVRQPEYPRVVKQKQTGITGSALAALTRKNYAEYLQQKEDSLTGRQLNEVIVKDRKLAKPGELNQYGAKEERFVDMKKIQQFASLEEAFKSPETTVVPFKGDSIYIDGLHFRRRDIYAYTPQEIESIRIVYGALPSDPQIMIVTTKRRAGTDTTVLKQVTIKGRRIAKPDVYNNYGSVSEYDVDMKRMAEEYFQIKESLIYVIPGLMQGDKGRFYYEDPKRKRPVQFIVDGFIQNPDNLDFFRPGEVESIRMIASTLLTPPTIILTTKHYAGTDTASMVKLKQVNIQARKTNKAPDLSRSSNLHGGGNADQVIMGKDLGISPDLAGALQGKLLGVTFSLNGTPQNVSAHYSPMSVIVDGNILSHEHLNDIKPDEVYSIEVLRSEFARAIYGSSIEAGALVITLKQGVENDKISLNDTTVLKQVNVTAKKITKKPELTNSDNLNGPGNADQVIMGDKIEGCITLSDCLNGKVFGVTFDQSGTPHSIRAQGRLTGSPPMVIIVDGNVMDGSHLNDINASDVYSIEVLRSGAYLAVYGSNAPGGALVITTRRGGESNYVTSETPAGLITYPFNGFYKARTFYSPKFSGPKTGTQTDDLRNTIYWDPNIITDKDGKASFEYFNNDTKGVYRIVIEGIDTDGNLGRTVYRYKVE